MYRILKPVDDRTGKEETKHTVRSVGNPICHQIHPHPQGRCKRGEEKGDGRPQRHSNVELLAWVLEPLARGWVGRGSH